VITVVGGPATFGESSERRTPTANAAIPASAMSAMATSAPRRAFDGFGGSGGASADLQTDGTQPVFD
jgi:hypothetical protein